LFSFLSAAYMLDTARVNARTIALLQPGRQVPDTRHFGLDLVRELVTPHIKRRLLKPGVQNFVKAKAMCYLSKYSITYYVLFPKYRVLYI
jgi:hypothetical protein